jgi:site-specific DNA-methyltransferase (adenine-specific)
MSDWIVHASDCLDPVTGLASLPDKSVDHVISDPPYEAEAHERQSVARAKQGFGRDGSNSAVALPFAAITEDVRGAVAVQMGRVARRWVVVFCQAEAVFQWRAALSGAGLVYLRACIWVKPDGLPQLSGDRPAQGYESIVVAHAPVAKGERYRWNGGGKHGVYTYPKNNPDRCGHPTQKPLALMEALIRDFTDPGDLICDPFAGSASTLVAAKRLGRRAIGFEREPAYCAMAEKRIAAAREQMRMFEGTGT